MTPREQLFLREWLRRHRIVLLALAFALLLAVAMYFCLR